MSSHVRSMTRPHRRLATILSICLAMALAVVVPGAAQAKGTKGGKDIVATTESYVETFYPLWFTHAQFTVAPHNQMFGPESISPVYQSVVAINDDTLYASSPIDVTGQNKVKLFVPGTGAGYSVLLLDPYGDVYDSPVPSKPAGSTSSDKTYELVGPDYTGDMTGVSRLPLSFMVLIFRVDKYFGKQNQTTDATTFRAALEINDAKTTIKPVEFFATPFKLIADGLIRVSPIRFLRQLQRAVHDTTTTPPLSPQDSKLSDQFDALFGDGTGLSPSDQAMFESATRSAHDAILSNYINHRIANNWTHFTNIGDWKKKDVLDRSSITEFCQYCNGISTAAYYHAFFDGNGAALDGSNPNGYVLTFPPGDAPQASRFWSLTAYTPDAIELIPNSIDKYVVASYTQGLVTNSDGSISIYIAKTKPDGVAEANWLPVGDGTFNVMLRIYGVVAKSDVAKNKYAPPPIMLR
jgi:hypothetical protein